MLAILKERGKKRRHHSPTLSDDPLDIPAATAIRASSPRRLEKPRKERTKRRGGDSESEDERERAKRKETRRKERERQKALTVEGGGRGEKGMFDMAYVKKGGVREWDIGK